MPINIQDKLEAEAKNALQKGKARFEAKNLPVETVLEAGMVPANLIIQAARDDGFDRIVIGSTGMNALERILMGSTASCGGVMYSMDPTDIRHDAVFLTAVHDLAKAVVDVTVTQDLWVIFRQEPLAIMRREIQAKERRRCVCRRKACVWNRTPKTGSRRSPMSRPSPIAHLALALEAHFQGPQDIEWCLDANGRLFILQSRPLQQPAAPRRPAPASAAGYSVLLQGGEVASRGAGVSGQEQPGLPVISRRRGPGCRVSPSRLGAAAEPGRSTHHRPGRHHRTT